LAEFDCSYVGHVERGDSSVAILALSRMIGALDIAMAELVRKTGP